MIPHRLETISVSELSSFRECRRSWYWSSIRGLVPKVPSDRLWFGTLMHKGLEEYYKNGRSVDHGMAALLKEYSESLPLLKEGYGFVWEGMETTYAELYTLATTMLENYAQFDKTELSEWDVVAVEERVWVPIKNESGRGALKGSPRLTARMDLLLGKGSDIIIEDHKTYADRPSGGRALDMDDQLTGYAYVYWRLTGELPRELVYDVLIKRVPNEPRILKDGSLSTDKDQGTLYGPYLEKMQQLGLMTSEKHIQTLEALRREGWGRFFSREITHRNMQQILSYQRHLYRHFQDMREVARDPRKAYPSPSMIHCPGCPFLQACIAAEETGMDSAEELLAANFVVDPEKRW